MYPTEAGSELVRVSAKSPETTPELLKEILERDGAVIVESLVPKELCEQILTDLKPHFDSDLVDASGFFPPTTKRATGLFATSAACVELALSSLYQEVAQLMLNSEYTFWEGQQQKTVIGKPQIASTVGFRVEPGGNQQALHRDDADYHTRNFDMPAMIGCVTVCCAEELQVIF
jgi:ectoine hydroxylase-related dioxygenase (phytanoyl-CoA dioxygenase family)